MEDRKSIWYYANSRADVRAAIHGTYARGLDVGCSEGHVGAALMDDQVVTTFDGIEYVDAAAEVAREQYDRVWIGAVEDCLASDFLGTYDLIICADILEHLVDPWTVLRDLASHLAENGRIVISIPNIRFAPVLLNLARGRFEYQDSGVMDRTHLRFFTRRSLVPLVEQAGLRVTEMLPKKSTHPLKGLAARILRDFGSAQFTIIAERAAP